MKKLISYAVVILMLFPVVLPLESCDDDDDAVPIVMVVAERSSGNIFTVNKTTGALTEVGMVTYNELGLTNIRGMIYNGGNKKIYASTTDNGGGKIFSIDPATMIATLINEDLEDDWYGVADLLVTADNKLLASLYYTSGSGPGLAKFNLTGEFSGDPIFFTNDDICCGMGIIYGSSTSQVIVSSYNLEIYTSDLSGNVTLLTTLVPTGFGDVAADDLYIQNMVKDSSGKIYAVVYDDFNDNTHLALVDLDNDKLSNVGQMNVDENRYHGLMLISQDLL